MTLRLAALADKCQQKTGMPKDDIGDWSPWRFFRCKYRCRLL